METHLEFCPSENLAPIKYFPDICLLAKVNDVETKVVDQRWSNFLFVIIMYLLSLAKNTSSVFHTKFLNKILNREHAPRGKFSLSFSVSYYQIQYIRCLVNCL